MNLSEKTDWQVICEKLDDEFGIDELRTIASSIGINVAGLSKQRVCLELARDYLHYNSSRTNKERKCHNEDSFTAEPFSGMSDSEVVEVTEGDITYCFTVDEILTLKGTNPFTRNRFPQSVLDEATEKKSRRGATDVRSVVHKRHPRMKKQTSEAQSKLKELLDSMNLPRSQIDTLTPYKLLQLVRYLAPRITSIDADTWRDVRQTYGKNKDEGLLLLFTTLLEKADKAFTETLVADFFAQAPTEEDVEDATSYFLQLVEFGNVAEVVEALRNGADPTARNNEAIILASSNGHTEIVKLFLEDGRADLTAQDNKAIRWASEFGHTEIVKLLLDNGADPAAQENYAIIVASADGHLEVVKLLLADERIDPVANDNEAIIRASEYGHHEVVELLLADKRADPTARDNEAIIGASQHGHREVVELLLADKRADPTAQDNSAIIVASQHGHHEVVKSLLADKRADPAAEDNEAIIVASQHGYHEVVKSLLADKRTDPTAYDNLAIIVASEYGRHKVVELLLEDGRADPRAQKNKAIIVASKKGHHEVVKLLLEDGRATPPNK